VLCTYDRTVATLHCSIFFFFFSSRRRHTRSKRDWSSDVCSSDLAELEKQVEVLKSYIFLLKPASISPANAMLKIRQECRDKYLRSEERRVGKECRCGRGRAREKQRQWREMVKSCRVEHEGEDGRE